MAHALKRLISKKILNKPHLISEDGLENILEVLNNREVVNMALQEDQVERRISPNDFIENSISIIPIDGPLTYKNTGWEPMCGGMSYQLLTEMVEDSIEAGVHTIVFDIDSPGGEAYGMMETARDIRAMADEAGVQLISYVDGTMASAATGLGVVSHQVIANPDAEVGSVGVVIRLTNDAKAQEEAGYETTYIYAGANKVPKNNDGSFREDFLAGLQDSVNELYEEFTMHVSEFTGMSQEAVKSTEAGMYRANKALDLGLITAVKTRSEFYDQLYEIATTKGEGMKNPFKKASVEAEQEVLLTTEEVNTEMSDIEMAAQLEAAQAQLAEMKDMQEQMANLLAQKEEAEKQLAIDGFKAKAESWSFAQLDAEAFAVEAIKGSIPVSMFEEAMGSAEASLAEKDSQMTAMKNEVEAMGEVGIATGNAVVEEKVDPVEAAAIAAGSIKS